MSLMDEVKIDSVEGRSLRVWNPGPMDADRIWAYDAEFHHGGGIASLRLWDYGDGLAAFFADLAAAWRGFDGDREWTSCEGNLDLTCRHDGVGSVICEVTLREPAGPTWSVTAQMTFGAGAHLERIAHDLSRFGVGS